MGISRSCSDPCGEADTAIESGDEGSHAGHRWRVAEPSRSPWLSQREERAAAGIPRQWESRMGARERDVG